VGYPGFNINQFNLGGPGDFEIKFGVHSDNFPSKHIYSKLHLGDNLEDLKFEVVK
jgi:hypothetical protein